MPTTKETRKETARRLMRIGWEIKDIATHLRTTTEWVKIWTK